MMKWFAVTAGALAGLLLVTSWPKLQRYRRIRAM